MFLRGTDLFSGAGFVMYYFIAISFILFYFSSIGDAKFIRLRKSQVELVLLIYKEGSVMLFFLLEYGMNASLPRTAA